MIEKIIIAGAGGQGIMLLGKVLAEAVMRENKFVTWLPSYGAEVRGGTAYCMIIVSDAQIGSPYIEEADTLIIMNEPSLEKFRDRIKNKGLLVVNSSLVSKGINKPRSALKGWGKDVQVLKYPFTDIAIELGNIHVANMVALSCYVAKKNIADIKNVLLVIEEIAPPEKRGLIEINKQAILAGVRLIK